MTVLPGPTSLDLATTTEAMSDDARIARLSSTTGLLVGDHLVIGQEMMPVLAIEGLNVTVRRGDFGTRALPHKASIDVYGGRPSEFTVKNGVAARAGYNGSLGEQAVMTYPLGSKYIAPDTGYEYRLMRVGQASFDRSVLISDTFPSGGKGIGWARSSPAASTVAGFAGLNPDTVDPTSVVDSYFWMLRYGVHLTRAFSVITALTDIIAQAAGGTGNVAVWDDVTDRVKLDGIVAEANTLIGEISLIYVYGFTQAANQTVA